MENALGVLTTNTLSLLAARFMRASMSATMPMMSGGSGICVSSAAAIVWEDMCPWMVCTATNVAAVRTTACARVGSGR